MPSGVLLQVLRKHKPNVTTKNEIEKLYLKAYLQ